MAVLKFITNYARKASAWLHLYGWMAFDAARSAKLRVLTVLVLSFLGVTARASTFGAILFFARSVETGKAAKLGPVVIPVGETFPLLMLWAGIVLAVGFISAVITYLAVAMCLRAGHDYEIKASSRLLTIIARSPALKTDNMGDISPNVLFRRLVRGDSRFMRRAYQMLLESVLPAMRFLIWAGVLVICDPFLTMIIVGIALFYLIPFYFVNRGAARYSREYESALMDSSIYSASSALQRFLRGEAPHDPQERWKERIFIHGSAGRAMRAYKGRLLVRAKNDMFNDLFFGLYLACILLVFGLAVLQGQRSWSAFATYIVALRLAQVNLKNFTGKISTMSRFQPQISRYRRFIRRHTRDPRKSTNARPKLPLLLRAENPVFEGTGALKVATGQSVLCLSVLPVIRYTLGSIIPPLLHEAYPNPESALAAVAFSGKITNYLPGSILYNMAGLTESPETRRRVEKELARLGVFEAFRALPDGLDTNVDDPAVGALDRNARYTIGAMPCLLSDKPFLAMDAGAIMEAGAEFSRWLDDPTDGKVRLLFAAKVHEAFSDMEFTGCVVLDESGIVGCGDMEWYRQHKAEIGAYLTEHKRREGKEFDEENLLDILVDDV